MSLKIGLFLEFDNVITKISSYDEDYSPYGLEDKYLENIKKILFDGNSEFNIKNYLQKKFGGKFSYSGCHIVSMNTYSKIKEITDNLSLPFNSITGSLEDIDFFAESSKKLNNKCIRFTNGSVKGYKSFDMEKHKDINTCQLWSNIKHEIIKDIIETEDIDYALVIDYDDIYNGYLYGIASKTKHSDYGVLLDNEYYYYGRYQKNDYDFLIENASKLIPHEGYYIYDDPKIIHLDIGFINYYLLNTSGVFHDITHFYSQIDKLDLMINIKDLYTLYINDDKINNNVLMNLSYLLSHYRIYNRKIKEKIFVNEYFYKNILFFDIIHCDKTINSLSFMMEIIINYIFVISTIFDENFDDISPNFICEYVISNFDLSFDELLEIYKRYSENDEIRDMKKLSDKIDKLYDLYEKTDDPIVKKKIRKNIDTIDKYFEKEKENIYDNTEKDLKKEKVAIFSKHLFEKSLKQNKLFGDIDLEKFDDNTFSYSNPMHRGGKSKKIRKSKKDKKPKREL